MSQQSKPRPRYGDGRRALLDAVARVVASAGLRGLTYRAVAAEAGVSHGSVTIHFGSRDAMIREGLAHAVEQGIARSWLEPGTGEVATFAKDVARAVDEHPEGEIFQYELALESRRRPDLAAEIDKEYMRYTSAIGRELARMGLGGDDALARFVAAAIDGIVFQQAVGLRGVPETEDELGSLREMLSALQVTRAAAADGG